MSFACDYDYSKIRERLVRNGMRDAAAAESIAHLRRLMILMECEPDAGLVVWEGAEPALHEMILDTAEYERFCEKAFGTKIHHDPNSFGSEAFRSLWARTVVRAAEVFGIDLNPDPDAKATGDTRWNVAAYCSLEVPLAA